MPPIINSNHSKITLDTKNVFIDITATDKTKLEIVNHMIISMFSQYCEDPFTIEPVKIISEHNHESRQSPDLTPRRAQAEVSYINSVCGLKLQPQEICDMLKKMCYTANPSSNPDILDVDIPITRADVLHQADIMEDAAIAYGFNNLERRFVSATTSVGAALPINKLSDIVRNESAMAGWSEVMPLILCSHDENYAWLNRPDDNTAVRLQNPKTAEYQIVRTSLLPGLLKTIRENKHHSVPMKIFEVSDVGLKDETFERKSRNERRFAACWYGKSSGFEVVHGLLDRIMLMLKSAFITKEEGLSNAAIKGYWIEEVDGKSIPPFPPLVGQSHDKKNLTNMCVSTNVDPTFFAGHSAAIYIKLGESNKAQRIGTFGIMHPTVLKNFELPFPVSALGKSLCTTNNNNSNENCPFRIQGEPLRKESLD